jgi:hypothetical protein
MTLDTANTAPPGGHSLHPYYPPHARIPAYVPNSAPLLNILVVFAATVGLTVTAAYVLALRSRRGLRGVDCFAAGWFALCTSLESINVTNNGGLGGLTRGFGSLQAASCTWRLKVSRARSRSLLLPLGRGPEKADLLRLCQDTTSSIVMRLRA